MFFNKKPEQKAMEMLMKSNIIIGCPSEPHEDAIRRSGKMLLDSGYVQERYIEGMLLRDRGFSTAIGNAIAIPHGEKEYKDAILATGLVVLTYPDGIPWNGETVRLVIGIAAKGDEHLEILENIVEALEDEQAVNDLVDNGNKDEIYNIFVNSGKE